MLSYMISHSNQLSISISTIFSSSGEQHAHRDRWNMFWGPDYLEMHSLVRTHKDT